MVLRRVSRQFSASLNLCFDLFVRQDVIELQFSVLDYSLHLFECRNWTFALGQFWHLLNGVVMRLLILCCGDLIFGLSVSAFVVVAELPLDVPQADVRHAHLPTEGTYFPRQNCVARDGPVGCRIVVRLICKF